jgi:ribosomal protein S18 acetylase RimI-like enzyme
MSKGSEIKFINLFNFEALSICNEMNVRNLRRSDKPHIRTLGGNIFREKDEIPLLQNALRCCIPSLSFVAVENEKIIGFALVGQKWTKEYYPFMKTIPDCYELAFLGISPYCQGRGIGTRLLKETLHAIFQRSNHFTCWLLVDTSNVGAIKMYQKWGFQCWKETTETEERGWIMGLSWRRYHAPLAVISTHTG